MWVTSIRLSRDLLQTLVPSVLAVLSLDNGDTRTNPYDIVNIFIIHFSSVDEATKKA